MTIAEFHRELENTLVMPAGSIVGNEALANLRAWDSMASIAFLAMADEKFGTSVSAARLADCCTVADLAALFPGKVTG
jgi:acyl carrier protein